MEKQKDSYEMSRGQYSKPWEELEITDNYLFCKIMSKPEFCKEMIERILGIKVTALTQFGSEQQYSGTYASHGIRLDVAAEDESNVYDIEFQSVQFQNLPKRMRFYQGTLDIDSLAHNKSYENLRETWIVFICSFDLFGLNESGYKVRMSLDSLDDMPVAEKYDDGTHKIFINLNACDKIKDRKLRAFLTYLKTKKPQDSFTEQIDSAVNYNRHNATWRKEYMTVAQEIEFEKEVERRIAHEQGLAEGHTAGLAEGREDQALEAAVLLITKYKVSPETAAEDLKLSETARKKLFEQYKTVL